MPFIRGRYYMNPVAGAAIEAARAAEDALSGADEPDDDGEARGDERGADAGEQDEGNAEVAAGAGGPVHRIEIEATVYGPAFGGRNSPRSPRGYVARVHRGVNSESSAGGSALSGGAAASAGLRNARPTALRAKRGNGPETHVFSDHQDLMSFLGDTLGE